jgi:hypothetical protein
MLLIREKEFFILLFQYRKKQNKPCTYMNHAKILHDPVGIRF